MTDKQRRTLAAGAVVITALLTATGCAAKKNDSPNAANVEAVYSDETRIGEVNQLKSIQEFCGSKPLKVALADGTGDNAWRKTARAEFEDEARKCPNLTVMPYSDAQNNPQKAISDIKALVAQGADAIVVFPDAGEALLPTLREAFKAGVAIVPWTANPGGTPGKDYTTFVGHNTINDGHTWARWTCERLGDAGGNVLVLGGTPGNTQSTTEIKGVEEEFAANPACRNVKLLNEPGKPIDTNWNPAQTQRVVAGLLTKYPKIDAIISDSGDGSLGGIRAFEAANRKLPLWTANDLNGFACAWRKHSAQQPDYHIVTVSSRTWIVRLALRKAVAAKQGITNDEPEIINIPIYEDSFDQAKQPKCDPALPNNAILSAQLSPEQFKSIYS
ncbi:substrate-binding domain-containing protein [Micromonospora inyonensis]|uniref:Ribose transport system substrate-binding protein n=1 Tax=Micromonospora inyonensis TaxID=47866 RepID=A0A1C6SI83_9ACTN|nr:substrate-binding domain-containing protein [Micromonospora inyonensis]SCL29097.1 ribose transport system substrate-binding protein [Micromonospora inyonensis]